MSDRKLGLHLHELFFILYFVLSSFSSSISFRDALTLLETSFPCEKSLWRSLKVKFSGAPPNEFSWSGPLETKQNDLTILNMSYFPLDLLLDLYLSGRLRVQFEPCECAGVSLLPFSPLLSGIFINVSGCYNPRRGVSSVRVKSCLTCNTTF